MKTFLDIPQDRILYQSPHFFVIKDLYPVSPGHCLIISNSPRQDYFELSREEQSHLHEVLAVAKLLIEVDHKPDGYNIGMNCGTAAGQTVMHFHCHLIPRYHGDMKDPSGGVRHSVEGKGYYSAH